MPELPEVEAGRRMAEAVAAGKVIASAQCADDCIVFADDVEPARVCSVLTGKRVIGIYRRGKHVWFELDSPPHLLIHFGMTGGFRTPNERGVQLVSSGKKVDASWPPRFTKLHLHMSDGSELIMVDGRRLARIRLRCDPLHEPPISTLGFDPLLELPSPDTFVKLLRQRRTNIKALLLDQTFAAGVGNWVADEVLYHARISPWRRTTELSDEQIKRLRLSLKRVIETAVAANAQSDRYPRTWLFHHRWGKNRNAQTARGERIRHDTIAGRTTAWVPAVQR